MTMNTTDPIRGKARGSYDEAIAILDTPDDKDREFVQTIYRDAPAVKIDPAVAIAHAYQETATNLGPLSSVRWNNDLNPAGIGIPQDSTPQSFTIKSGAEAARIYLVCLNRLANSPARDTDLMNEIGPAARSWIDGHWAEH